MTQDHLSSQASHGDGAKAAIAVAAAATESEATQPGTTESRATQPGTTESRATQSGMNNVTLSTEKLEGRQRRIIATIQIPQTLETVWQILTDYDALANFIPNLAKSQRLPHPQGGIRLEQIGTQCFLNIQFCARVVLDMYERFPHELGFQMVEGDFKRFEGCWRLEPIGEDKLQTSLSYELLVKPPLAMPVGLIEKHIRANLTENLMAIQQQAVRFAI